MAKTMTVDARGDLCPIPVVKTKKAIDELKGDGIVTTHVDNEIAVQNLMKMAKQKGYEALAETKNGHHYVVTIRTKAGLTPDGEKKKESPFLDIDIEPVCQPDRRTNTVVAVDTAIMGRGNDELGKVLIKGFIYAVSQLDTLPSTILFYNGGATLTTEGSDSLEDLRAMEAQGVNIRTCGTCLNYYGLTEKLAVGEVTNMYDIVETLAAADKVIKP